MKRRIHMKELKKYFVTAALAWVALGLVAVAIKIVWHKCSQGGCNGPWEKKSQRTGETEHEWNHKNGSDGPAGITWAHIAEALEAATAALNKAVAMVRSAPKSGN